MCCICCLPVGTCYLLSPSSSPFLPYPVFLFVQADGHLPCGANHIWCDSANFAAGQLVRHALPFYAVSVSVFVFCPFHEWRSKIYACQIFMDTHARHGQKRSSRCMGGDGAERLTDKLNSKRKCRRRRTWRRRQKMLSHVRCCHNSKPKHLARGALPVPPAASVGGVACQVR